MKRFSVAGSAVDTEVMLEAVGSRCARQCRCTVSTGICVERVSVLMADVLVIAMVETSRHVLGVFL